MYKKSIFDVEKTFHYFIKSGPNGVPYIYTYTGSRLPSVVVKESIIRIGSSLIAASLWRSVGTISNALFIH